MNNRSAILLSTFLISAFLFSPCTGLRAESEITVGGTVKLFSSAYTQDDKNAAVEPHESGDYSSSQGELRLKVYGYASDNVSFSSRLDYIYTINPQYDSLSELESGSGFDSEVSDTDLNLREASFKVIDFLTGGMDLIVGRQRVRWGTSDEYNVIDNLNPVDFASLFSFDPDYFVDHVPMDGLTLEYQSETDIDLKLQLVYFLSFKPSPLSAGFETLLLAQQQTVLNQMTTLLGLPTGVSRLSLSNIPEYNLHEGPRGLRISGNLLNFDLGLSYYYGHQILPLPKAMTVNLSTTEISSLDLFLEYPRLDVIGFDLAGELHSIGVWGEVGVYIPEENDVWITYQTPLGTTRDRIRLLERTYTKFTVGFDYTFGIGDGLYWNTQYNRGFYDEFAYTSRADRALGVNTAGFMGRLEDYYISTLEYSFFSDEWKLIFGGMLEVADYNHFSDEHAWMLAPEIEYKPFDGVSLSCGYAFIEGENESKFGAFEKGDIVYLLLKGVF